AARSGCQKIDSLKEREKRQRDGHQSLGSNVEVHAVECDFPSGAFDLHAFCGIFVEDRVGIVDMDVDLAAVGFLWQRRKTAAGDANRQMAHRKRGFLADALRDNFVISPARAVEQDAVASGEHLFEMSINLSDTRDVSQRVPAPIIDEAKA